jgi:ribosome assembly protein YihI (activator of Der GTPase)
MKKNPKDPKILSKKKNPIQWCSKSNEENKNKEKEPKPNTGGHDRSFWKEIQMTKG